MTAQVTLLFALTLYTVVAAHASFRALARHRALARWAHATALLAFALHTLSLGQRWATVGHFPAVGLRDTATVLGWVVVLVFLLLSAAARLDALALVALPAAFALTFVATLTPPSGRTDTQLQSLYLPVHATFAFFGGGALFVACVLGALYLIQERELRAHTPSFLYYFAPSLERCDTLGGASAGLGLTLLTLAIVSGMVWSHAARGTYFSGSAKEWSAAFAWLIYVALVVVRLRSGWGGRRAALLAIAGFVAVVFVFAWLTFAMRVTPTP
jgi:ABC-type transport system involved in cytochrome c biogenesis permease subunit